MHTRCQTCSGTGRVIERRARWVGGTISGYESVWVGEVRCESCSGAGVDSLDLFAEDRVEADRDAERAYLAHLDRLAELEARAEAEATNREVA